ncbi:MAG: 2-oxoglutarate dehydrogenase complex dihydrolipoyllysine-residue succinyltransferase, partial [Bdellovibrionota bacterium]
QAVKNGEIIAEIESDKATVEIAAEASGALTILKPPGERIPVGSLIAQIDDAVAGTAGAAKPAAAAAPVAAAKMAASAPSGGAPLSPAVRRVVTENNLDAGAIAGTGRAGRLTKGDALRASLEPAARPVAAATAAPAPRTAAPAPLVLREGDRRVPMSMLRQKIAERLVQAQHTAAILTTFNEADMTAINKLRTEHKEKFKAKHGVSLGFMSFFTRAAIEALKILPEVNASTDGRDVIYHDYYDVGIAVGTERGLVVPVIRGAEKLGFVEIEKTIADFGARGKIGKLTIAELTGGTVTISNGGVYGSLLSTPILNPPQSAILGMHKIQDRPIAVDGKIEIRPMMYLALSYDHRLIDGKGAVTFLVTMKDFLEHPEKLKLEY